MDLAERLSKKCTDFVSSNLDKTETELEQIQYGIHVILINVFKLIILFVTAYFLGVLRYTFIAFISFGALRTSASGIHASSSVKCIIVNYIVFLGCTYSSIYISLNTMSMLTLIIVCLILALLYAPADTEERPLTSKKHRTKLKFASIITIFILSIIAFYLPSKIYASLIIYSMLEECILITPFIYIIFGKGYKNYEKVEF